MEIQSPTDNCSQGLTRVRSLGPRGPTPRAGYGKDRRSRILRVQRSVIPWGQGRSASSSWEWIHGFPWIPMGSHGFPWIPMGPHGFPWVPMGIRGFAMDSHKLLCVPMGYLGGFYQEKTNYRKSCIIFVLGGGAGAPWGGRKGDGEGVSSS